MTQSISFLFQQEQTKWNSIQAQAQARVVEIQGVQALVELERAKISAKKDEFEMHGIAAAYAKTKLELAVTEAQHNVVTVQASSEEYKLETMLPTQNSLLQEQLESERAKTLDTRSDGSTVAGTVGKQKDLYTQQIDSFQKDAKHKIGKMYLDAWITQKTLDEGLLAPDEFTNTNFNEVLESLRSDNDLS